MNTTNEECTGYWSYYAMIKCSCIECCKEKRRISVNIKKRKMERESK